MNDIGFVPLVKRWWKLLALSFVVAGVVGFLGAQRLAPTYQADVKLLVGPVSADYSTLRASGELGRTYAELATSRPVLDEAIKQARVDTTVTDLLPLVKATSNEITRVVVISVQQGSPEGAARVANAVAERIRQLTAKTEAEDEELLREFETQAEIEALLPEAREGVVGAAQRTIAQSAAGRLAVIDPAEPPEAAVAPNVPLISIFAAIAGLLLTGIIVLLRETSSDPTADEESLVTLGGPPFLGTIEAARRPSGVAVENRPESPAAERYRAIAAKVGFLDDRSSAGTLLVLGDGPTGGVVAANLAAVLAEAERRVLLVDADSLKGSATTLLGLDGRPGYGELLASSRQAELNGQVGALQVVRSEGFVVVPKGTTPSVGLLDVERAQQVVERLRQEADLIVVSAPPIHQSPAALVWSRVADGTVLVVDEGRTPQQRVKDAVRSLSFSHANLVGTILGRSRTPRAPRRR